MDTAATPMRDPWNRSWAQIPPMLVFAETEIGTSLSLLAASDLYFTLVDLGMSPLCESYVTEERLNRAEHFFPLHVYVCDHCFLAQLEEYVAVEEIFGEYAYFSSYRDSWVDHAGIMLVMITKRFGLGPQSRVIELASNDGYLLQHFLPLGNPGLGHRAGGERRRRRPSPRGSRPSSSSSTRRPPSRWSTKAPRPTC